MKEKAYQQSPLSAVLAALFVLVGVAIAIIRPFAELDSSGQMMLGSFISGLAIWIIRPGSGSFFAGSVVIILGGSLSGISLTDLTSGFASPAFWLLIPAMFLGSALQITGLGKRIVFALFTRIRLSYKKILFGWLIIGVLFSLLTPSISVRIMILTPIAVSVADACRLEKQSKGRSLIVISAWCAAIFPGIAWFGGSLYGPVFSAFLPEQHLVDMVTDQLWLQFMALPWLLFSVAFLALLYLLLKPEKEIDVNFSLQKKMYEELGPAGSREKRCLAVFLFLLANLLFQLFLPINTTQVLLASMFLLLFLNVMSVKDVSTGINWDVVMFFGMLMGLSHLFDISGIKAWISPMLLSMLEPLVVSPLIFLVGLYALCAVIRILDVTQGWVSSAVLAMAAPMLLSDFGLHPILSIMAFVAAGNIFLFKYHQPWITQAESVSGDRGWNERHQKTAAWLYVALVAAMLVMSNFYWSALGLI